MPWTGTPASLGVIVWALGTITPTHAIILFIIIGKQSTHDPIKAIYSSAHKPGRISTECDYIRVLKHPGHINVLLKQTILLQY
jgi:hypothetical protein